MLLEVFCVSEDWNGKICNLFIYVQKLKQFQTRKSPWLTLIEIETIY